MCGPKFCSMKLSHDIRDSYKEQLAGMKEKAKNSKQPAKFIIGIHDLL